MSYSLIGVLVVALAAEVSMLLSAASPRVLKFIAQLVAGAGILGGFGYGLYFLWWVFHFLGWVFQTRCHILQTCSFSFPQWNLALA